MSENETEFRTVRYFTMRTVKTKSIGADSINAAIPMSMTRKPKRMYL